MICVGDATCLTQGVDHGRKLEAYKKWRDSRALLWENGEGSPRSPRSPRQGQGQGQKQGQGQGGHEKEGLRDRDGDRDGDRDNGNGKEKEKEKEDNEAAGPYYRTEDGEKRRTQFYLWALVQDAQERGVMYGMREVLQHISPSL